MKIGHLIYSCNPGGMESFVTQLIEASPAGLEHIVFTFNDGPLRKRMEAVGAKVLILGHIRNPLSTIKFIRGMRSLRPDVFNCHIMTGAGVSACVCKVMDIPFILYSHANRHPQCSFNPKKFLEYLSVATGKKLQTYGIGVSQAACKIMWGDDYQKHNAEYVCLGVNFDRYKPALPDASLKRQWNIPENAKVIANVAGYRAPKNYSTFINIAAEIVKQRKDVRFLLIGNGLERKNMERQVENLGLQEYCILTGFVDNVPELLKYVVDVFLFPSLYEGLGLGLVEAQAAGCYCVYSDAVPQEAIINPGIVKAMSLKDSAEKWADVILQHLAEGVVIDKQKAYDIACNSSFNIANTVEKYQEIWTRLVGRG